MTMPESMSKNAKRVFEAAYKQARIKNDKISASKIAMNAVKKVFKKEKGVWVKKHLAMKLHLIKHGLLFPSYKFEIELSNNKWDSDNQKVSESLLQDIVSSNNISTIGDVDHEAYYKNYGLLSERDLINQDKGTEGLYFLDSYKYSEGSIKAVIGLNKRHSLFNKYLDYHKQGKFLYASAEFPNATIENGVITHADKMLWSITDTPAGDVSMAVPV